MWRDTFGQAHFDDYILFNAKWIVRNRSDLAKRVIHIRALTGEITKTQAWLVGLYGNIYKADKKGLFSRAIKHQRSER